MATIQRFLSVRVHMAYIRLYLSVSTPYIFSYITLPMTANRPTSYRDALSNYHKKKKKLSYTSRSD